MMTKVYISLGANLGDRESSLRRSLQLIEARAGHLLRASSLYLSEPWGFDAEEDFLNQVVLINTELSPEELLTELQKIENELGRTSKTTSKYESRIIDLDILFYGDRVVDHDLLKIPHPGVCLRKFVLLPLNEIESEFRHPVLNDSVNELLEKCKDHSKVRKLS